MSAAAADNKTKSSGQIVVHVIRAGLDGKDPRAIKPESAVKMFLNPEDTIQAVREKMENLPVLNLKDSSSLCTWILEIPVRGKGNIKKYGGEDWLAEDEEDDTEDCSKRVKEEPNLVDGCYINIRICQPRGGFR
jgi:hypothetical protein